MNLIFFSGKMYAELYLTSWNPSKHDGLVKNRHLTQPSFRLFCSFLLTPDTLRLHLPVAELQRIVQYDILLVVHCSFAAFSQQDVHPHPFSKINNQYPKDTNKLAGTHNNCHFQEAEKLCCFDTPAGAKEISAIKIIATFEKLKSCFEELQLIFAI